MGGTEFFGSVRREASGLHGQLALQQQGCDGAAQVVSQQAGGGTMSGSLFTVAALESGPNLADHAFYAADGEIDLQRNGRAEMLHGRVGFVWFGLDEVLVHHYDAIGFRPEQGGCAEKALSNGNLLSGGLSQRLGAFCNSL
jgi:hypothetical protein